MWVLFTAKIVETWSLIIKIDVQALFLTRVMWIKDIISGRNLIYLLDIAQNASDNQEEVFCSTAVLSCELSTVLGEFF